jgi:hypothetical protein
MPSRRAAPSSTESAANVVCRIRRAPAIEIRSYPSTDLSSAISIISALLPCCCPARGSSIASATRATSAFSIFTFRFYGYHPYAHDLADLGWYIGEYARLMAHSQNALPNPTLAVELRDWVEDFAGTLRRVIEFLELPYDPACECFYERDSRVRTVSRSQGGSRSTPAVSGAGDP